VLCTGRSNHSYVFSSSFEWTGDRLRVSLRGRRSPWRRGSGEHAARECRGVYAGDTIYVEYWAADSGTTNTGIVSAYADINYTADLATCNSIGHTDLFNLFPDGICEGSIVDEIGGSQLDGGVGVEPEWVRVAYVEFTVDGPGLISFVLLPAEAESSAFNRGLILPTAIDYGSCTVMSREPGACCHGDGICSNNTRETNCLAVNGRYLGDGVGCEDDADRDDIWGCDDVCPTSPAPAGVDWEGRPLGDFDGDCDVDLADFETMQRNLSGPSE